MRRMVRTTLGVVVVIGLAMAPLFGAGAFAAEAPADELAYTMLGRGYAAIMGYPADEVPGGGDEEGEEDAPPEDKPPNQTCPKGQRGVSKELQKRINTLTNTKDVKPVEESESDTPSPRGQPIKFDFGLADTSLRSDPGSHSISSFFYVDLGGGQDPWTTAETDGYASGHVRRQERCAQPYSGKPGDASDVHVISETTQQPYAYAFNQTQNPQLPAGVSMKESITVAEMHGGASPVRGKVASIATGVTVGIVHADHVVSVVEYVTDGSESGTTVKAFVDVAGLNVAGTPLELTSGAPPVNVAGALVGIAAPEIRRNPNGKLEVTVGGLYVGGEFSNPLGAQSKQAVFIAGVWYDASTSLFPAFDSSFPPLPPSTTSDQPPPSGNFGSVSSTPRNSFEPPAAVAPPPVSSGGQPATAGLPAQARAGQPQPSVAPPVQPAASIRFGVYRAPPHVVGPLLVALSLLSSLLTGAFVWARHRYPEIRAVLGIPMFRWADYAYRAFMRG